MPMIGWIGTLLEICSPFSKFPLYFRNLFSVASPLLQYLFSSMVGSWILFSPLEVGSNGHDFDFTVDRVQKKLTGWKTNLLSMAGRLVLATSVTSAIPSYVMQGALLPSRIHNALDKVNRNFIQGSTNEKKKFHLVNWQKVTRNKNEGGLGVKAAK